jgi:hypothetical protein
VGDDPVVSYVGIRGDEDREGYISTKPNIQSIFPFRQNIWSEDVIGKVLSNANIENVLDLCAVAPLWRDCQCAVFGAFRAAACRLNFSGPKKLDGAFCPLTPKTSTAWYFAWLKSTTQYPISSRNGDIPT